MRVCISMLIFLTLSLSVISQVTAKHPELDTKKYPDFWSDYETLGGINELYYGGLNTEDISVMRSQVENLLKNDSTVQEYGKKYEIYLQTYKKVYRKPSAFEDVYIDAKNGIALCLKQVKSLKLNKEQVVTTAYHKIDSLLNLYLEKKSLFDDTKNPLFGSKSELTKHVNVYIAYQWMLYLENRDNERKKAVESVKNKVNQAYQAIRTHILENTNVLPELYEKPDKEQIREYVSKKWKEKYPKDEILKIYLPEKDWQKDEGKFFDNQKNETLYFDKSLLVLVVIKKEQDIAELWQADLKRHENTKDEIILIYMNKTPDTYLGEVWIKKLY